MHDLGTLGGDVSIAYGINNIGHVTGESQMTGGNFRAFLYDGNEMHDLGCVGDGSCASFGTNINDYDQVVGYTTNPNYAFLYENNEMQDIGTLGGDYAIAHDINSSVKVVGTSTTTSGSGHAFIFDGNDLQDLGTLDGYGSTAWGINNLEEVVGDSGTPSGVGHAFIWDSLNGMRDLNYMIPTDSGWELRTAQDINDVGQICWIRPNRYKR
jgi:probable HAF family extracellular repeat protein